MLSQSQALGAVMDPVLADEIYEDTSRGALPLKREASKKETPFCHSLIPCHLGHCCEDVMLEASADAL